MWGRGCRPTRWRNSANRSAFLNCGFTGRRGDGGRGGAGAEGAVGKGSGMPRPGLRGRSVHVIGPSGTEGSAVIDFLLSRGMTTITAHDLAPNPEQFAETFHRTHQWLEPEAREGALARLLDPPGVIRPRRHYLTGIERADPIVVPQHWFPRPEK